MMISPVGGKNRDKQPGTKGSSPSTSSGGAVGQRPTSSSSLKPPEQALRCPRCDSSNTKFCYYNNYSLTQPRHFCKTCRRYWTKGGALRNVPIGGGCRKTKKAKSGRSSSSLINSGGSNDYAGGGGSSVAEISGFKLFQSVSPAADFQLSLPRLYNNFSSSGISCFQTDQVGPVNANFPISSAVGFSSINRHHQVNAMHGGDHSISAPGGGDLASSIESLSCINQDMHWKLQQQRIASMIQHHDDSGCSRLQGSITDTSCATATTNANFENQAHVVKPFAGLWMSGGGMTAAATTVGTEEWFLGSSFAPAGSSSTALPPGAGNGSGSGGWSTGVQAWSDLQQFTHLP